jgi:hypothetical protein
MMNPPSHFVSAKVIRLSVSFGWGRKASFSLGHVSPSGVSTQAW